jgi:hypothetical protein
MTMNEGMILHGYYKFIERIGERSLWLFKVLGGCTYCSGFWLYSILFLTLFTKWYNVDTHILIPAGILGIGFNYVFIKAIERLN